MDLSALCFYTVRSRETCVLLLVMVLFFHIMSLPEWSVCYFRRVRISREKNLLFSSCLSVRLSACISSAPTGQIFVKFIIGGF